MSNPSYALLLRLYIDIMFKVMWILFQAFYAYFVPPQGFYLFMNIQTIPLCDKCKKNEIEIYNDDANCCISCWYDMTDPKVPTSKHLP